MTALAEGLADLGHEVAVVTAFPHYGQGRPYEGYAGWRLRRERHNGIQILRTPLYVGREGSTANKILSWFSFNVSGTWGAIKAGAADIVIAPSPPPTLGLSEWILSQLWHVPYIYNVQDIYPDVAIEQGLVYHPRLIAFLRKVEDFIYRKSAAVTVLSEAHRANLLAKGVPSHKAIVIPNFVDTDALRPVPRHNNWSAEQGLSDRFVVTYAGNIGASQGLETLLEAARFLHGSQDIVFLVIGRGTGKASLEAQARAWRLTNVRFLPFQPLERLAEVYASADLHLVLLRRRVSGSVPSKTYSIMSAGRPLLAAVEASSEVADIVQRAGAGLVVPPEDPKALAEAILNLAVEVEARRRMGQGGRTYVVEHHSRLAVSRQYDALIQQIAAERSTPGWHVRHHG